MAFSIRLTDEERALAESYAKLHSFSLSEAFKKALFEKIEDEYDLIVANLPYVDREWDWTSLELAYEPQTALYAEDGGLALIKQLIEQAPAHLRKHGYLLLEADLSQHKKIANYASNLFDQINPNDQTLALSLCLR